jgi:hypothetical protein
MSGFIEIYVHDNDEGPIAVRCSEISRVVKKNMRIIFCVKCNPALPILIEKFATKAERDARYREVMLELTGNGCALRDKLIRKHQDEIQENKGE